jgi:hypothetical protein
MLLLSEHEALTIILYKILDRNLYTGIGKKWSYSFRIRLYVG